MTDTFDIAYWERLEGFLGNRMTGTFHIVSWDRLEDFLAVGWMVVADLGDVHGRWSCLCEWKCDCVIPNVVASSSVATSPAAAHPVPKPDAAAGTSG